MSEENKAKKLPQFLAAVCVCIGAMGTGTVIGWTSNIHKQLEEGDLNDVKLDLSWAGSVMCLGAVVVCIPIGIFADLIGRKLTVLALIVPFILGWVLIICTQHTAMLLVGRFLTGMAGGAFCTMGPMYTSEIAQNEIRGTLGTFMQLFITIGILWSQVLGWITSTLIFSITCAVVPAVFGLLFMFQPESPVYLIKKGKKEKALAAFSRLRGKDYDPSAEIAAIEKQHALDDELKDKFKEQLKSKQGWKSSLICFMLMFYQQLCGINAVMFYSGSIFAEAASSVKPELCTVIVGVVQVVCTVISTWLVEAAGRKLLLMLSSGVMALATLLMGVYFLLKDLKLVDKDTVENIGWLPLLSLTLFIIAFSIGLGPIPWLASSEIFPTAIRSRMSSYAGMFNWFLAFCVAIGYAPISKALGTYLYNDRTPCSSTPTVPLGNTNIRYPTSSSTTNGGSDRYSPHGSLDRYHHLGATYSRTSTPSSERYLDKNYHLETVEATAQATACTIDRYTPTERHRRNSKSDVYKIRERSTSSDRKERLQREHLQGRGQQQYDTANSQYERPATPSILACPPAPAPFGGPSSAVSEPPSPAPACDRFVAPPPADGEPETTDCYAHGAFPSPIAPASQERFAPPPLPAPSPTEDRPASTNSKQSRYHQQENKYHYTSPNQSSDRYYQYKLPSGASPTPSSGGYYQTVNNGDLRFSNEGQRYVPPNAHMPVERYVPQPQPQEPFYNSYQSTYERYPKPSFVGSDPYMRRDLTYHYRLPIQFGQNQYQKIRYSHLGTPSRAKCCQFETTGARSSPGSSSSTSSVASGGHASSLQDVQCQNYQVHYQQEKSTQCPINASRTLVPCRHGGCDGAVEYVGASGGRRICATPPPRPQERCEGCIQAAAQAAALAVAAQINAQQKNGNRTQQQTQLW
ncbi:unnamed protein product [Ceutorhynchus assimilis]|uniref:Major facilitator superfamily (MFS) profile domain-containing protein n=1 Tax=Ceutorhynchus assimilis TaxID=467358 RepID=A0A9N9MMH6_9CUCU|nr:unnamed protein product [Ceutorhynchus assimilis]